MDREVIEQKLESLRRCVQRIETRTPTNAAVLAEDIDLQDIVTLNLSRVVQICVDIGAHLIAGIDVPAPNTMGQTFDLLAQSGLLTQDLASRLKKSVGFRNIAVHNYEKINWEIVHRLATLHLSDFSDFASVIALRLDE
jgi:uncharacterized protein YutE (UPF0331/DUF86 family)